MKAHQDVADLLDGFLICRTIGHSWDDNPSGEVDSDLWRDARAAVLLRCTRCGTERFDYLDREFQVAYRYYRYPDKYAGVTHDEGGRATMRAELFSRSLLLRRRR